MKTNTNDNSDFILWNNKKITVEKKSFLWESWYERGIYFISDILNSDGKFLTLDEFQNKQDLKVNYLHYFQLIAAIPSDWKRKAFDFPTPDMLSIPLEYHHLEDRTLVLPKLRCKDYYRLFIEKLATEPSAIQSWKKYFPKVNNWKKCFAEIYKSSKDNKLRQFSLKLCTE